MLKKIVRIVIKALSILITGIILSNNSVAFGATAIPYADMKAGDDGYDILMCLQQEGVLKAQKATPFRPNDKITAGEFLTLLETSFGAISRIPQDGNWETYSSDWFKNASVTTDDIIVVKPTDKSVTGAVAARLLLSIIGQKPDDYADCERALNYKGPGLLDCTEYVLTAARYKYIEKDEKYQTQGGYNSFESMTRLEAAKMVYLTREQII